ncbi:hypothetical protein GALL_514710 [mine drainage metagenome]|uniref:NAD-specific glutamate dehydrogenase n=1 Tax=mine drainage metagenome TaxID=410659 RepID=A0A1J5PNV0_9ZZZZ
MHGAAVERDAFDAAVGGEQDRAAGGLIDAARLHADEAVLDPVEAADAIVVAELVQLGQQGRRAHPDAVDGDGVALLEVHGEDGGLIGGGLGRDGAHMHELGGLHGRILQHLTLRGGVQQVGVDAEGRLAALVLGDLDLVLLGEVQQGLAALEVPLPPRRDHVDVWSQGRIGQFVADLIVSLARRAVADGLGAQPPGDLDLPFGDQRPGDRGAEQVLTLIDGVGAEHGEDEVADELLAHVLDEDVLRLHPGGERLGPRRLDLLALAQVGGEGHDLRAIFRLQPLQDDRGVQPARIGEDDFLDRGSGHDEGILGQGARGRD